MTSPPLHKKDLIIFFVLQSSLHWILFLVDFKHWQLMREFSECKFKHLREYKFGQIFEHLPRNNYLETTEPPFQKFKHWQLVHELSKCKFKAFGWIWVLPNFWMPRNLGTTLPLLKKKDLNIFFCSLHWVNFLVEFRHWQLIWEFSKCEFKIYIQPFRKCKFGNFFKIWYLCKPCLANVM